jgi:hypothetical protein
MHGKCKWRITSKNAQGGTCERKGEKIPTRVRCSHHRGPSKQQSKEAGGAGLCCARWNKHQCTMQCLTPSAGINGLSSHNKREQLESTGALQQTKPPQEPTYSRMKIRTASCSFRCSRLQVEACHGSMSCHADAPE